MAMERIRVEVEGIVQGVGFRPFIYRIARKHLLSGWVRNTPRGVLIEAEGERGQVDLFYAAVSREAPPLASISLIDRQEVPLTGATGFEILASSGGAAKIQVPPDTDVCPECLKELFDPADRRYRYPFINCTNCGPRYSIITGIPYDRPATTMADFVMCPACRSEYSDPGDRRFHAQPIACPDCGPRLWLTDCRGSELPGDAVAEGVRLLEEGRILAVKGLGGFHLAADATNHEAVTELRRRKRRSEKPFALMFADMAALSAYVYGDALVERLLTGPEKPIVLLARKPDADLDPLMLKPVSPLVAPGNGYLGVMLPATPLHHLLLQGLRTPLVMTSGNLSDEPIEFRNDEALATLAPVADYFLLHDREIYTRIDDSVIRVFRGNPLFLRRSRGYVPRGVTLPAPQLRVLAMGGELKGAICLTREDRAFMSHHIGDLQNATTLASLDETVSHLEKLLEIEPELIAHDLHPDYLSSLYAGAIAGVPKVAVQHHHAHMASCMAENGLEGEVIGIVFDGTGFGLDGNIWGGEFLWGGYCGFQRMGHFDYLPLPGGDAAVREPFRTAIAALYQVYGDGLFELPLTCLQHIPETERPLYLRMLARRINSPLSSSCGRLFDAVAALLGVRSTVSYEGQGAIELEALAEQGLTAAPYPIDIVAEGGVWCLRFHRMFVAIVEELLAGRSPADIARTFHLTVAAAALMVCDKIRKQVRAERVVLSGGAFQNRLLTEELTRLLVADNFVVHVHRLVPPNDGGLALGQAIIAGRGKVCV
jgi:hydrogenase maturation protein HypF